MTGVSIAKASVLQKVLATSDERLRLARRHSLEPRVLDGALWVVVGDAFERQREADAAHLGDVQVGHGALVRHAQHHLLLGRVRHVVILQRDGARCSGVTGTGVALQGSRSQLVLKDGSSRPKFLLPKERCTGFTRCTAHRCRNRSSTKSQR